MHGRTVHISGDELRVAWDGNVWVSPTTGSQHARARDAMRVELEIYLGACGCRPDDPETRAQIEGHLGEMTDIEV
jgi:hypothetical protein